MKESALPFLLPMLLIVFFGGTISVLAEIKKPYVIDQKPQVLFGDSIEIISIATSTSGSVSTTTYRGLENYTQDYVGGYAHFTFTYTHNACCFASYPPIVYITDTDPRSTSTPTERTFSPAYTLTPYWGGFGEPTDWYSYNIQFDATGYTVVVQRAGVTEIINEHREVGGLTSGDWVSLVNRYPMSDPPIEYSMAFIPVPIRDVVLPPEPQTPDPVIIVPGIMGSAYKNDELIIDPILHTYDDLIATLIANGYTEGEDLFTFPYEWRDSNVLTANLLDDRIEEVKSICDCDKVDLVAHSMGGLVARAYIQSVDYDDDVDQLIFLGTPHKGAPTDYLTWEAGQNDIDIRSQIVGMFFTAEALKNDYLTTFDYIRDRPILSVQELLPIFDYIKDADTDLLRQYPNNYPQNIFLKNLDNNISNLLSSGVEVTNIVGDSGENKTIERVRVIPTDHALFWEHGEPEGFGAIIGDSGLERGIGDNTVTQTGSLLDGSVSEEISASHNRIPTVAANRIIKIITGEDSTTNIDNGSNIDPKVLLLQLLSPIDVVVTAPDGKKIGKNFETAEEYNEISLSFYSGFKTDDEYITILNPLDGEYKVEIQGTDNGGEYGILTSYISDEVSVTKEISGLTESGQITVLNVEVDNDNPETLAPEKIVTPEVLINNIIKAYELGWIKDKKTKDEFIKKIEKIYKKDKGVDKKLTKILVLTLKLYRKEKIDEQAYNIIKEDLEWLINN